MKIKQIIRLVIGYPLKVLKWIRDGRFHNVTIIVTIVTLCYFLKVIHYEQKVVAAIFLVVGLAIIIWQMIGESRRFSEQKPNTFKIWIKKFPNFKPKSLQINVGSGLVITTGAKAHVRVSISENASLEEKVNFLMKQKEEMETAINHLVDRLDNTISEVTKEIKEVESKVEETKKNINSTISDVTVGNFDLKLLSIWLMIWGTLMQILI